MVFDEVKVKLFQPFGLEGFINDLGFVSIVSQPVIWSKRIQDWNSLLLNFLASSRMLCKYGRVSCLLVCTNFNFAEKFSPLLNYNV